MITLLKKYARHISVAITWTIIILILMSLPGSLLPHEESFKIPNFDKLVHAGLFGLFVLLWSTYFSEKKIAQKKLLMIFFRIFIIAMVYGATTEIIQKYFIPGRDFDVADILADTVGAGIAYGICNIYLGAGN